MILLGGWIYEGLSTDTKPLPPIAKNGQIFKEVNTGESYHLRAGVWEYVNLGLSFIRATKSGMVTTDASGVFNVSFDTPFINNQYCVSLTVEDGGTVKPTIAGFKNIATNGFTIQTRNSVSGVTVGNVLVSWVATRSYNPSPP